MYYNFLLILNLLCPDSYHKYFAAKLNLWHIHLHHYSFNFFIRQIPWFKKLQYTLSLVWKLKAPCKKGSKGAPKISFIVWFWLYYMPLRLFHTSFKSSLIPRGPRLPPLRFCVSSLTFSVILHIRFYNAKKFS